MTDEEAKAWCYIIGGPWIAEDPNCPVHGLEAASANAEIDRLRAQVAEGRELLMELRGFSYTPTLEILDRIDAYLARRDD